MTKSNFILSSLAFYLSVYFLITIFYAHVVKLDLDIIDNTLSYYALGEHGLVLTTGFYSIGLSQVLLAKTFVSFAENSRLKLVAIFMFLAGLGAILVALFPKQPDTAELVERLPHIIGAITQFLFFPLAVLSLHSLLRPGALKRYTSITGYFTLVMFAVLLSLFILKSSLPVHGFGLLEKLNIFAITFWILFISNRLSREKVAIKGDGGI